MTVALGMGLVVGAALVVWCRYVFARTRPARGEESPAGYARCPVGHALTDPANRLRGPDMDVYCFKCACWYPR